jgi:hypothetical protein
MKMTLLSPFSPISEVLENSGPDQDRGKVCQKTERTSLVLWSYSSLQKCSEY